jgi:hypothetical protein
MPDRVNDVLAFCLENISLETGVTTNTTGFDMSWAERGVTVSFMMVVTAANPATVTITPEESEEFAGPYTVIPDNRLIGSEFFVKSFGKDKLFSVDKSITDEDALSYFQILQIKKFMRMKIETTGTPSDTFRFVINVFGKAELSPVINNSFPFTVTSP